MGCNVYGTPVTDATLKGMTEYHDKEIQVVDRARVALQMKNAEGKDIAARTFVDTIRTEADRKGVRCLIYNATGSTLKLAAAFDDIQGELSESPYPTLIQNGQWASFVHQMTGDCSLSVLVYEAIQYPSRQWLFGWYHGDANFNKCYAELHPKGYYSMADTSSSFTKDDLGGKVQNSTPIHEADDAGDIIISTIGNTDFSIFEATMTKKDAI